MSSENKNCLPEEVSGSFEMWRVLFLDEEFFGFTHWNPVGGGVGVEYHIGGGGWGWVHRLPLTMHIHAFQHKLETNACLPHDSGVSKV